MYYFSISNCTAIVCSFRTHKVHRTTRLVLIFCFLVLYLAFTIEFGIRLREWDVNEPGHCYKTSGIALDSSKHPYVDHIYLAMTCVYLIGGFFGALFGLSDVLLLFSGNFRSIFTPSDASSNHSRDETRTRAQT